MNDLELKYAELIFSTLKEKWVYNESNLLIDTKAKANSEGIEQIQELKHILSFMEEMGIIRRVQYPDKTHIYITLDSLKFDSFHNAKFYFDQKNEKNSEMIDLDIKRAKWDIRTARYGWFVAGLAGAFLKDGLIWLWELIK